MDGPDTMGSAPSAGKRALRILPAILLTGFLSTPIAAEAQSASENGTTHVIPLFTSADAVQQGFARVINHSGRAGRVSITGTDDEGREYGPVTLSLDANQTRHFNSRDLESGNAAKGLSGRLGNGRGSWRLRLQSELDIEAAAYIRTPDGFLSSVHDVVPVIDIAGHAVHHVPIFNPGSNRNQVSWLRVVNLSGASASVSIGARDDEGRAPLGGGVRLTLPAGSARELSAQQLESGGAGLSGRLGDGTGKWQLFVSTSASGEIEVLSLMRTPSGHLTNLSLSGPHSGNVAEPASQNELRYPLALFPPAGQARQGFARIINRSNDLRIVNVYGTDDAGVRRGPIFLLLGARESQHFNSEDLEAGNPEKGLHGALGGGTGDWRLEILTGPEVETSAYIRTPDGFLTAMHAVARSAEVGGDTVHRVPVFNPGSNRHQVSWLRVANLTNDTVNVEVRARDDDGRAPPLGDVRFTLPAREARRVSAQDLEQGASGLRGRFGDGEGKWQLTVTADGAIEVLSLLMSPTGHLSNLSTTPRSGTSSSVDGNDSPAQAVDVAVGATVSGRVDSPDDADYFRLRVAQSGTLVVWTSGDVATDLELLDEAGNALTAAARPSTPPSSRVGGAKATNIAPNFTSREVKVRAGDHVIVKVGHKSGVGGFKLDSKNVRLGVTNVNTSNPVPSVSVQAGAAGVTLDLAAHFHNPNRAELTYSASVERKLVGGLPLNVGISVSGSRMTIIAPQSGPAYSGTLTITVRVTDPLGLLYAELEIPMQFTRVEQIDSSSGLGCVEVGPVRPRDNTILDHCLGNGFEYLVDVTNQCDRSVYVRGEWSRWSDSSPNPSSGLLGPISPGGMRTDSTSCLTSGPPTYRTCAFYGDFSNHHICDDF